MRRLVTALLVALGLVSALPLVGAAQDATPASPAPGADTCPLTDADVDRLVTGLEAAVGTPVAATAEATPVVGVGSAPTPPTGRPADDATVAAATETIEGFVACINAGYELRIFAFFSDRFLVEVLSGELGAVDQRTVDAVAEGARAEVPQPLPADEQTLLQSISDVQVLDDGRVVVAVIGDDLANPGGPNPAYFILIEQDGRFLIDEVIDPDEGDSTPDA